ncbi:CPBP family intramembrane glutamic endopeptidase [uncultured Jatrophihabitans sp.]|uniref:CPBP family intramembrane glutamic endopeptidase n=1 Tax=uncultured Jatrophihabitans sp. TaxID=1610747 RepID=UPI0035CBBFA3
MSASTDPPVAERAAPPRFGLELVAVLGVSYGLSGLTAFLDFLRSQIVIQKGVGFSKVATAPIKSGSNTVHYQYLDILDQLASILAGLAPAFLAVVLLLRTPGGRGLGIGLNRFGVREVGVGLGFAGLIGIPGLGLVYVARELGLNAQIVVTSFPDVWYRVPTLLLEAFQQGIGEEVVVCAFVLTRLAQLGWSNSRALALESVVRGSYHLYQGFGGFVGNAIMGVIFGWWFQRTKRVWPLVIAHGVIDAMSFIGYVYLHGRVSWI